MKIIVLGACNIDLVGHPDPPYQAGTSNIGKVRVGIGGVGHNLASALARYGRKVELISVIPETLFGELVEARLFRENIGFQACLKGDFEDSFYLALEDAGGELIGAVNQMDAMEFLTPAFATKQLEGLLPADLIVVETNLRQETLEAIAQAKGDIPLAVEGVSVDKVGRLASILGEIDLLKVNEMEARALAGQGPPETLLETLVTRGVGEVHLTRGSEGVLVGTRRGTKAFCAEKVEQVDSVNKAGDLYFASVIHRRLAGDSVEEQVRFAQQRVADQLRGAKEDVETMD